MLFSDLLTEVAKQAREDYQLGIERGIGCASSLAYAKAEARSLAGTGGLSGHQLAELRKQYEKWYRSDMEAT